MKEMRRKDIQLTREESMDILVKGEYGVLATINEEGYPYGVPVSYAADDEKIYIHGTSIEGQKAENIKNNFKVCFTVVGDTEVIPGKFTTKYESVIVYGTAALSKNPAKGLEKIINKYSSEFKEKGMQYIMSDVSKVAVYEVSIDKITGKKNR